MKKLFSVVLAGVILSSMAASVSAHWDAESKGDIPAVPAGQITIDGQLNEAVWADALQVQIDQFNTGTENDTRGTAYMLWSVDTWYLFVEVKDADVQVSDESVQQETPWNTDSVEMFFDFGNEHADLVKQFRVDYSGWPSYYEEGGGFYAYGPDAKPYFGDYAVQIDSDGYNIEMAINVAQYGLKEGDAIGIQLQINDITAESPTATYAVWNMNQSMGAGSWDGDLYDYVVLGAELKVEEPVVDEPAVDEPAVDAPVTEAPVTADAGIVAAAAVMAVAAGVVLSKKH